MAAVSIGISSSAPRLRRRGMRHVAFWRPAMSDEAVEIPIERELDLHPFAARDIHAVVEAFVTAAHGAGLRDVRLVHGRGKGVQRGQVQAVLERHPLVASFRDDLASHLGATLARLVDR